MIKTKHEELLEKILSLKGGEIWHKGHPNTETKICDGEHLFEMIEAFMWQPMENKSDHPTEICIKCGCTKLAGGYSHCTSTDATCEMDTSVPSLSSEAKACEQNLEMDAGAGKSDYTYSLTFTSSKFIVTAFGHDRDHCEDVLQCVLLGKFKDHECDREFERVA
jgi:hypothetical protein